MKIENDNVLWKCDIRWDLIILFWHEESATMSTNIDPAQEGLKVFACFCQDYFQKFLFLLFLFSSRKIRFIFCDVTFKVWFYHGKTISIIQNLCLNENLIWQIYVKNSLFLFLCGWKIPGQSLLFSSSLLLSLGINESL